ncbi:MAG TPA: GNAT family N-acetyltransferase [Longimicrobiales bacterium]|nr:GNAT family N-acetyltransferase [Longimicrobiales bacterium]
MAITVRRAGPADRDALWRFDRQAFPELTEHRGPERWRWQYERNPALGEDAPPVWVAEDEGRIVGQICAIPVILQLGGEALPAAWGADFIVLPGADPRAAYRLMRAVAGHYGVFLALAMADTTRRILMAMGARELPAVPTLIKPVRLRPDGARRILIRLTRGRPRLARLARFACDTLHAHHTACTAVNIALTARDRLTARGADTAGIRIEAVERFEDDVASAIFDARDRPFSVAVRRDAAYLNWRFADGGGLGYRIFVAYRDGEPDGYLVLRRTLPCEMSLGVIAELYARGGRDATHAALIRHAERHFGTDVAALVCATSLPEQQAAFRRAGFIPAHEARPMCWSADPGVAARLAAPGTRWFLTRGDHDWDTVRPVPDRFEG